MRPEYSAQAGRAPATAVLAMSTLATGPPGTPRLSDAPRPLMRGLVAAIVALLARPDWNPDDIGWNEDASGSDIASEAALLSSGELLQATHITAAAATTMSFTAASITRGATPVDGR